MQTTNPIFANLNSPACLQMKSPSQNGASKKASIQRGMHTFAIVALVAAAWSPAAYAYRPFEGTDANTAEAGTFELELGGSYLRYRDERSLQFPAVVANWGITKDSEIVLEGVLIRRLGDTGEAHRTSLEDTALSLKHVFRRGTLQEASGPSIAGECGILLPTAYGPSGTGASCALITSISGKPGAIHFNAALMRTRERTINRFVGVIVEGPDDWKVRPVAEFVTQRTSGEARINSVLLGAIWKKSEHLSFDVALRRGRDGGENISEIKAGLTYNFEMGKS